MTAKTQLEELSEMIFGTNDRSHSESDSKIKPTAQIMTRLDELSTDELQMKSLFGIDAQESSTTLCRDNISKQEWDLVAKTLSTNPRLQFLTLKNLRLEEEGCRALEQVVSTNRSLQFLNIWACSNTIPTKPFKTLLTAIGNSTIITELAIMECQLEPSSWIAVADLLRQGQCALESLYLQNSNVTPEACQAIAQAVNSDKATLTRLSVPASIGTKGQLALAKTLSHDKCSLTELYLNDNEMALESCLALSEAITKNKSLISLGLEEVR